MNTVIKLTIILIALNACKGVYNEDCIKFLKGRDSFILETLSPNKEEPFIRSNLFFNNKNLTIMRVNGAKYDFNDNLISNLLFDCQVHIVKKDTLKLFNEIVFENEEKFRNNLSKNHEFSYDITIVYKNKLEENKVIYVMDTTIEVSYKFIESDLHFFVE